MAYDATRIDQDAVGHNIEVECSSEHAQAADRGRKPVRRREGRHARRIRIDRDAQKAEIATPSAVENCCHTGNCSRQRQHAPHMNTSNLRPRYAESHVTPPPTSGNAISGAISPTRGARDATLIVPLGLRDLWH
ncbi:MAG: hypothetical protein FJ033_14850 [Chloroflexi bacterium]|nr:hypothetical protein [Chloroflexota bacterium]